jgi:histidinol-phosphate phosphatase family protein
VSHRAVFLDRDGVLMYDLGYVSSPDRVTLLPDVPAVLQQFRNQGFRLVVITNQSGIGRGLFTHAQAAGVADRFTELLAEQSASVDATYVCPHSPDDACDCRKPKPGMLLRAARELDLDLSRSFMIGDRVSDCEAAEAAGCQPILLAKMLPVPAVSPSWIVVSELSDVPGVIQSLAVS